MSSRFRALGIGLLRLMAFPAVLFSLLILRLFMRRRVIRIVMMEPRFFGHQCLEPEVFWNEWQSSIEQGSSDLWLCCLGKRSKALNQLLWDLRQQALPVIPSWVATTIAFWHRRIPMSQVRVEHADYHRLNFLTTRPSTLPRPSVFDSRRREILSYMTQPERPYVILTVREVAQGKDLRNRDIEEFEASILLLIETGHNVIRLTSHTNNPLQLKSPHLLDWQVTKFGKQGDELALVSGASFVVSTTTGIDCLALAFRRPVLYVDVARLFYVFLGTELTTFQMPQVTDWESGEPINLEQILERGLGFSKNTQSFVDARVRIVNSSPEQLASVIREYISTVSSEYPPDDDALQGRWRELVLHHLRDEVTARHGAIRARMHPATMRSHL